MTSHLMWSTATALVSLASVFALRKRSAGLRFAILLVAMLRFAVPTPWLSEAGSRLTGYVPVVVLEDMTVFLRHPGDAGPPAGSRVAPAAPLSAASIATIVWVAG